MKAYVAALTILFGCGVLHETVSGTLLFPREGYLTPFSHRSPLTPFSPLLHSVWLARWKPPRRPWRRGGAEQEMQKLVWRERHAPAIHPHTVL